MSRVNVFLPERPVPAPSPTACARCQSRACAVCADADTDCLTELDRIAHRAYLAAGESFVLEGEDARFAANVISGGLKVQKSLSDGRTQSVCFLYPGEFFGLPLHRRQAFSATAFDDTELCLLPRPALNRIMERHPDFERRLFRVIEDQLAAASEHLLLLGRKSAIERVASFLLDLQLRATRRGATDGPIGLPLTRLEIADYLGLTIETVSRCFTRLRQNGVVETLPGHPARVHILDLARLAGIAKSEAGSAAGVS